MNFDTFLENKELFVNSCELVKKMSVENQTPQMEGVINTMKVVFENLGDVPFLFDTKEKDWDFQMPEEGKRFWNSLTTQEGVVRNRFKMQNGDTVYYYTVSPCNKELWNDLTEAGGAFCQPELGLIFMKEGQDMFSPLHELGHIDFRAKARYRDESYKVMSSYDKYHSEEIWADNFAIDNWDKKFGNLKETLIERIKGFLDKMDFYTSIYHFPRVINLWERYKELSQK